MRRTHLIAGPGDRDAGAAGTGLRTPNDSAGPDPVLNLAFLHGKADDRTLRLFACACCRLVWDLLPDAPGRARVEAAERAADGLPVGEALAAARPAAGLPGVYAEAASIFCGDGDAFVAALAASLLAERSDPRRAGRAAQAALLADLVGGGARKIDGRWRTPEVVGLARTIYDRRRFGELPRLADALEGSGCDDRGLLAHCRERREHVRGCWAVDLLIGRPGRGPGRDGPARPI